MNIQFEAPDKINGVLCYNKGEQQQKWWQRLGLPHKPGE